MTNKPLIVFDLDNTLITGNTLEHLNTSLGVTKEQDSELYSAFTSDKITYQEWLEELKKLYKLETHKHSKAQVLEYLTQYELKDDAKSALQTITSQGFKTLLLAGSFQMTADAVAFELGIDKAIATTKCIFDDTEMLSDIYSEGNERQAKVTILKNYCRENNISTSNCIAVGSGGNNADLFAIVSQSITFTTSSKKLQANASNVVDNLSEVATLLHEV